MNVTKNFSPLRDPKLKCTCKHKYCDGREVRQLLLDRLQKLRDLVDRPMKITSGGRCPHHPNEVHRTKPADHQLCWAVDVAVSGGIERAELVKYGIEVGFNAIGVAGTFVHLGYRPDKPLVMWTY